MDEIKIKRLEDLQEAQAGSQANGGQGIANYYEWADILTEFDQNGIESTGTYAGDMALREEMRTQVEDAFEEYQKIAEREQEQVKKERDGATENITKLTDSDSDQALKANFAAAKSSDIMADFYKYYFNL